MTAGVKLITATIVIVVLVAAPTQAADLISDLFHGIMSFLRALG